MSMMLSREHIPASPETEEWKSERKLQEEKANQIISEPEKNINSKEILKRSMSYAHEAAENIKLFISSSDEEQLNDLHYIEYAASMTLLPEAILIAGHKLLAEGRYQEWWNILKNLRYVPLQKAFCYNIRTHKDFLEALKSLHTQDLDFPNTFLWSFLNHWLEWLVQTEHKLDSYLDPNHIYDDNALAQSLKEEASAIQKEWDSEMPSMIHEILSSFSQFLSINDLFVWSTKKHLRDDEKHNSFSRQYNHIIALIWKELIEIIDVKNSHYDDMNLNMLILLSHTAVEKHDENLSKKIYDNLKTRLLEENYINLDKKSSIDERRQLTISNLIDIVTPDGNFVGLINDIATRFQGWKLDYKEIYKEAARESYLLCCIFRIFQIKSFPDDKLFGRWKDVVDVAVREYSRCDNEYIKTDEFCVPFRVAIEVAEELNNQECRQYLHDSIINNILSIKSLLSIFSECRLTLTSDTIANLLRRIDIEWDSAKVLMKMRGQIDLVNRIENFIKQIRKFNLKTEV